MPRALLSVYDKTGVVDFASALHELGWDLLASGGTAQALRDASLPVVDIADVTGYPAILGHRVVTLHPSVHGGILADTTDATHRADLERHNISPIDLVAVSLYPFDTKPSIELIDIGGPSLVRGAAKNHARVAVVTDRAQYGEVLDELLQHTNRIKVVRMAASMATRMNLPWAAVAEKHSERIGGGARWVAVGRTGERLDLKRP